ncbi:MAG: hypothetical protein H6Q06_2438, partial [Acidobacteria bacterium]|nr:hypothetical protein [Acidobacteriota bacterium]
MDGAKAEASSPRGLAGPLCTINRAGRGLGAGFSTQERHGKKQHQLGVTKKIQKYLVRANEEDLPAAPAL